MKNYKIMNYSPVLPTYLPSNLIPARQNRGTETQTDTKLEHLANTGYRNPAISRVLHRLDKDNPKPFMYLLRFDEASQFHNPSFPPAELFREKIESKPQSNINSGSDFQDNLEQRSKNSPNNMNLYSSGYSNPYGAKSWIELQRERAKKVYRELGDYASRIIEKLKAKKQDKASYNSVEAIAEAQEDKAPYPSTPIYAGLRRRKYNESPLKYTRTNIVQMQNPDATLDDILEAA